MVSRRRPLVMRSGLSSTSEAHLASEKPKLLFRKVWPTASDSNVRGPGTSDNHLASEKPKLLFRKEWPAASDSNVLGGFGHLRCWHWDYMEIRAQASSAVYNCLQLSTVQTKCGS